MNSLPWSPPWSPRTAWLVAGIVLACGRAPESAPARPVDARTAAAAAPTVSPAGTTPRSASADSPGHLADRGRIQGDSAATLWVVIISDFQCPYCKQWHDSSYASLRREYVETGRVRVAYVNLPLPMHANAWPAAEVAMCSSLQGRFWAMHDAIFDSQERWTPLAAPASVFDSLAARAGVDVRAMRACVDSKVLRPLIQADYDRSVAAGVSSTPTFLVGAKVLEGALPFPVFRQTLDSALHAASAGKR